MGGPRRWRRRRAAAAGARGRGRGSRPRAPGAERTGCRFSANSAAVIVAPVEPGLASASEPPRGDVGGGADDRRLRARADRAAPAPRRCRSIRWSRSPRRRRADRARAVLGRRPKTRTRDPLGRGRANALDHDLRPGLGPERVERDRHPVGGEAPGGRAAWASTYSLGASGELRRGLVPGDDLATGVGSAGRADAMRQPWAVAMRALVQTRGPRSRRGRGACRGARSIDVSSGLPWGGNPSGRARAGIPTSGRL